MEILLPVSILNFLSSSSCSLIMQGRNKFCLNWTITERVMTLCRFFQMADIPSQIFFAFWFYDISPSRRQRTICVLNFDQISQSTAEMLLLLVAEDKRPPYLNSTPGFNFDLFTVIGMWFGIDLPYAKWMITDVIMTLYRFHKMAVIASQIYFRFLVWPRLTCKKV